MDAKDPEQGLWSWFDRAMQQRRAAQALEKTRGRSFLRRCDDQVQAREIHALVRAGDNDAARALLPVETPYPSGPLPHLDA